MLIVYHISYWALALCLVWPCPLWVFILWCCHTHITTAMRWISVSIESVYKQTEWVPPSIAPPMRPLTVWPSFPWNPSPIRTHPKISDPISDSAHNTKNWPLTHLLQSATLITTASKTGSAQFFVQWECAEAYSANTRYVSPSEAASQHLTAFYWQNKPHHSQWAGVITSYKEHNLWRQKRLKSYTMSQ